MLISETIVSKLVAREILASIQNGEELHGTHPCNNKTQMLRKNSDSSYSASYYDANLSCDNFSGWMMLTPEAAVEYLWKMRKWFNESLRQQQDFERREHKPFGPDIIQQQNFEKRLTEAKEEVSKLDISNYRKKNPFTVYL
jgi:hypothetical protein